MQDSAPEGGTSGASLSPSMSGPPSLRSLKMVRCAGATETSTLSFHEALVPAHSVQG